MTDQNETITTTVIDEQLISHEEINQLNERKEELKRENEVYIREHPELRTLLSSFMTAVLLDKPEDVYKFSIEHFGTLQTDNKDIKAQKHKPLIVAGPSGVGKGTLIRKLIESMPNAFGFSVSHTTREPRPGETLGVAYNFRNKEKMLEDIEAGKFIEHAEVHGNLYGTDRESVEKVQAEGKICILDIDIQGVQQVKESLLDCNYLFVAPPSMDLLEERLRCRGTETEERIKLRLQNARDEMEYAQVKGNFDRTLVNDDLDVATDAFKRVVKEWYQHLTNHN